MIFPPHSPKHYFYLHVFIIIIFKNKTLLDCSPAHQPWRVGLHIRGNYLLLCPDFA